MPGSRGANVAATPPDGRARILSSGADLFNERGFGATKLEDVAAKANVSRALVYHYFPGKAALLTAIVEEEADRVLAATEPNPDLPTLETLRRGVSTYLDYVSRADGASRIFYRPGRGVDPSIEAIVERNLAVQTARIVAALSHSRTPPKGLELVVRGWLGAVIEIADRWAGERRMSKRAAVDVLVAMLLAGVEAIGVKPPIE